MAVIASLLVTMAFDTNKTIVNKTNIIINNLILYFSKFLYFGVFS